MAGAKGSSLSKSKEPRVAVTARFSTETFEMIEDIAEKERRSISQLITFFCEYGLTAYRNGTFKI